MLLLAAGHPNQAIADALYLSLNTVKWHTSQIYGKLGVASRVRRSPALGSCGWWTDFEEHRGHQDWNHDAELSRQLPDDGGNRTRHIVSPNSINLHTLRVEVAPTGDIPPVGDRFPVSIRKEGEHPRGALRAEIGRTHVEVIKRIAARVTPEIGRAFQRSLDRQCGIRRLEADE